MRAYGFCLALLLPLLGCSLTIRNPKACLFDGVPDCPSGMICDPVQNACVLPDAMTDAGATDGSVGDGPCVSAFCRESLSFAPGMISSIWGSGPSDIWVTELMGAIDHFDGTAWLQVRGPGGPGLYAIAGLNSGLIWAVGGSGTILQWSGSSWTPQLSPATGTLRGIWAVKANQAWAVGADGVIVRYDGTSWNMELNDSSFGDFLGIWAADANNAWAVSNTGRIAVWKGSGWSMQSNIGSSLLSVYGTSVNNVWTVGAGGVVLRYDGANWLPVQPALNTSLLLNRVFCPDANTAWAVGMSGIIYRLSQGVWTKHASPTIQDLTGVWGVAGTATWITSLDGGIFRILSS